MATCIQWGEERHQECDEWKDEGSNQCSDWDEQCCDWWPCSWACKIVTWVCVGWVWISNWVCIGWTWVSTAVCVFWDAVFTLINAIWVTIESVLGWVLSAIAAIIELIEMIPVLGTLIRWVINFIGFLVGSILSIGDFIAGLVGIRPEKLLRVCTVILRDEKGNSIAATPDVVAALQLACDVYKRDANVRIIPLQVFKYTTGFLGSETVDESWIKIDGSSSDSDLLDQSCNAGGEWWLSGTKFQAKVTGSCFYGAWRRVTGFGAPVAVFIVRSVPGAGGCCLWITDYATVDAGTVDPANAFYGPRVIGHENGHACNLWHVCVDDDIRNLMAVGKACSPSSATLPDRIDPRMSNWQVLLVRASKHVTYF
jgi:hypothetical protein